MADDDRQDQHNLFPTFDQSPTRYLCLECTDCPDDKTDAAQHVIEYGHLVVGAFFMTRRA